MTAHKTSAVAPTEARSVWTEPVITSAVEAPMAAASSAPDAPRTGGQGA